jgi:hypothetical protein
VNDVFCYLVEKYGAPQKASPLSQSELVMLHDRLPSGLLDFWREFGAGSWLSGKFQFCSPAQYKSIVDLIFRDDPQFQASRTHLYGYTAFGELWLWNEDFQRLEVSLPRLWAASPVTSHDWTPRDPDRALLAPLSRLDRGATADWREDTDATPLMFERVRRALGELDLGECYGFIPTLQLGGAATLETVRRMPALEHFAALAQLGPIALFDYSETDQHFVRTLGGPAP